MLKVGFDAINSMGKSRAEMIYGGKYSRILRLYLQKKFPILPTLKYNYPKVVKNFFSPEDAWENVYPSVLPQWDRTPRAGNSEGVYINATPENFQKHMEDAVELIKEKQDEHKILFIRSWNEWGEGNYVEPDLKYGHGFLTAIKKASNKIWSCHIKIVLLQMTDRTKSSIYSIIKMNFNIKKNKQ